MNIAYVVPKLVKQGPVLVVYEIVKEMSKRGHTCIVYYFDPIEKYKDNVQEMPCAVKRIDIKEELPWEDLNVVHTHCARAEMYMYLHRKKAKSVRFITTIHSYIYEEQRFNHGALRSWLFTQFHLFLLKKADLRVVLSKQAENYYKKYFPKEPVTYIYNSRTVNYDAKLTPEERSEIKDFDKGSTAFLGVNALLTPRKAVDVIINALPLLDSGYKLFVAGDGPALNDLKVLAEKNGVADRVHFAGYRKDAYRYIPYYDIFMMPSRSEGFPMALTEAMAFKCNAVVSDIPIFKEFFTDEEMTFFKLDNPQDLARAIQEAMVHPKGEKAYQKYMECYNPTILGDMYEKVYKGSDNPHDD